MSFGKAHAKPNPQEERGEIKGLERFFKDCEKSVTEIDSRRQ
ncbi:MAG TPA: hypothetical protein V6D25_12025 [Leptolyngbyaceae cyanobacterium]